MANVKISDLTGAASASGTQEFEVNDSGTSKKVTGSQLATFIEGEVSSSPTFTGQVSLDNGTNTAPSLTNTGDTNTGLYFPSDDTVGLAAGGGLKLSANASGIDVNGTVTADGLTVDGGTIKLDGNYPVGTENVALGNGAFDSVTTGQRNVAIGDTALTSNSSGQFNTAVGTYSLYLNTTADHNTAIGYAALDSNTTGATNVAVGSNALGANTTASANTAVGYQAGYSNTAANNTFVGFAVGYASTTGTENVGIGGEGVSSNTTLRFNTSGSYNTAIGIGSLSSNTTASYNTAVGYQAAYSNTTGVNTAIGQAALYANTTGTSNTAIGKNALGSNTTASNNTAVGYQAAYSNTTGAANVYVGYQAGYAANYAGNGLNTFVGMQSGYSVTSGRVNTLIGYGAGGSITTGSNNTILGSYNGNQGGLDIRTSSNNIVLADGDGNPRIWIESGGRMLVNTIYNPNASMIAVGPTGGNGISIESNSTSVVMSQLLFRNPNGIVGSVTTSGSSTSYNTSSDYRLKENVVELTGATDRLKQIPVHRFNFTADPNTTVDGFIAHEVQAVVPEAITGTKDAVDDDGNPVYQGIDQSKLVPLLVATIQELEARITALETP